MGVNLALDEQETLEAIICIHCETKKPINEYIARKDGLGDGYYHTCNDCHRILATESYYRNRMKHLRNKREYYLKNKDNILARRRTPAAKSQARISNKKRQEQKGEYAKKQAKARNKLNYAIRRAKFPAVFCHYYLGYEPEHWFDVIPLCRRCHVIEHVGVQNSAADDDD